MEEKENEVSIAKFEGHWMGGMSVVTAPSRHIAKKMVKEECYKNGLTGNSFTLTEVSTKKSKIHFLRMETINMKVHLYKLSGYEEAIMSLRMSKGKFYTWETAQDIQDLVYVCTNRNGEIAGEWEYDAKVAYLSSTMEYWDHPKVTGVYEKDIEEFKRLLELTMNNAMKDFKHHTLMKYIDISFFTEGLHRGAQDDLDAHAIAFNNRITRFSTRLAEIPEAKLSEWYRDKLVPLSEVSDYLKRNSAEGLPSSVFLEMDGEVIELHYTPFGYMKEKFFNMSQKSGLYKDVARGGMPIGMESNALWKIDLFNLRYVYHMRSKLTKANPELRDMMEQLADKIEDSLPVFGEYFRKVYTDSGRWEHTNKVRTITKMEYEHLREIQGWSLEGDDAT